MYKIRKEWTKEYETRTAKYLITKILRLQFPSSYLNEVLREELFTSADKTLFNCLHFLVI